MSNFNLYPPGSTADFVDRLLGQKGRNSLAGLPPHLAVVNETGRPSPSLRRQFSPGKRSRKQRGK
jgi:hypothetical protein